jgi:hypothetical protein
MSSLVNVVSPDDKDAYENFVVKYWNWLLSSHSNQPLFNDVLYCRPCYKYKYLVDLGNEVRRINNLCGREGNEVTANSGVTTDTPIVWPFIDAQFNETHRQREPDRPFDESLMRAACNFDIDRTVREPDGSFASIPTIITESGRREDIVHRSEFEGHRMEIPRPGNGTFQLTVDRNSPLRDKLEDPSLDPGTYNATVAGFFLAFKIKEPGTFTLTSSASGPREYKAIMTYHITIPP